jgi:16S rRNA (uracil1498-N3)-methyltransferase
MECLYISELSEISEVILLNESESKHTKSLRLGLSDKILITNGKGLSAKCELVEINKKGNTIKVIEFFKNYNELECNITIANGVLDNTDRFEFLIEKSVELGVKEIVPLLTQYSSDKFLRYERAVLKSIAALKQSKRSLLPDISVPVKIDLLIQNLNNWDYVILADENGSNEINVKNNSNILILCGPEGGFSDNEINNICKSSNVQKLKISTARLRSETAAIAALSVTINRLR